MTGLRPVMSDHNRSAKKKLHMLFIGIVASLVSLLLARVGIVAWRSEEIVHGRFGVFKIVKKADQPVAFRRYFAVIVVLLALWISAAIYTLSKVITGSLL